MTKKKKQFIKLFKHTISTTQGSIRRSQIAGGVYNTLSRLTDIDCIMDMMRYTTHRKAKLRHEFRINVRERNENNCANILTFAMTPAIWDDPINMNTHKHYLALRKKCLKDKATGSRCRNLDQMMDLMTKTMNKKLDRYRYDFCDY
jgi:hypothetical protein